jgi:hypothetical protein
MLIEERSFKVASELASAYSYRPGAHASWFEQQNLWFRWAMSSSQYVENGADGDVVLDKAKFKVLRALSAPNLFSAR